jgi:polyphosphate kinase
MSVTPRFFNRELSWLAFNRRVLDMALDDRLPPLERLRFLAITASNLDEFFMIRVGGLQTLRREGDAQTDIAGMRPSEQLTAIRKEVVDLITQQYRCLLEDLEPKLAAAGIRRLRMADLTPAQAEYVERVFEYEIFSLLTPMALDLDEPFPLLSGLNLHLGVRLKTPKGADAPRWALVSLPRGVGRFVTIPSEQGFHYMLVEDIVGGYLDRLFPGEQIVEQAAFRITRNADLSVREDAADDLLAQMKELLTERRQSSCVRLEIAGTASEAARDFLKAAISVEDEDLYVIPGPLALGGFIRLAGMAGFDALRLEPWVPQPSPLVRPGESVFEAVQRQDLLLFHPYEQFDPVQRLVEESADDPNVLAIKQILYRTSDDSPIVAALMKAAERNKNVTVVVELKARFDEARNIEWATALERAGAQVVYGVKGLKTHAKVCIVVRREPAGIRRYVHFGTGNYNERTARLYSDVSLLTCNEDLAADAAAFFNTITGYSRPLRYRKIEAAPHGLRERLRELIRSEIERGRQGQEAWIMAKVNSLADAGIIAALYEASQNGVGVDLNVRGICCLMPGVPGLSEKIRVVSIVDRFLEHARILYFHNGGDPRVFISSADWMPRNLDRRVELLIPVENPACRNRLIRILQTCFEDNTQAWELRSDGSYCRRHPPPGGPVLRSQQIFYQTAVEATRAADMGKQLDLEPVRPARRANPP